MHIKICFNKRSECEKSFLYFPSTLASNTILMLAFIVFSLQDAVACPALEIPAEAKVVALSTDTVEAISDLTMEGNGGVVGLVDVVIEEGEDPLFLVATSLASKVWRVTGDVDRVVGGLFVSKHAVEQHTPTPAMVAGIASEGVIT